MKDAAVAGRLHSLVINDEVEIADGRGPGPTVVGFTVPDNVVIPSASAMTGKRFAICPTDFNPEWRVHAAENLKITIRRPNNVSSEECVSDPTSMPTTDFRVSWAPVIIESADGQPIISGAIRYSSEVYAQDMMAQHPAALFWYPKGISTMRSLGFEEAYLGEDGEDITSLIACGQFRFDQKELFSYGNNQVGIYLQEPRLLSDGTTLTAENVDLPEISLRAIAESGELSEIDVPTTMILPSDQAWDRWVQQNNSVDLDLRNTLNPSQNSSDHSFADKFLDNYRNYNFDTNIQIDANADEWWRDISNSAEQDIFWSTVDGVGSINAEEFRRLFSPNSDECGVAMYSLDAAAAIPTP
ncbi:MAG: hypothetical protein AAGH60_11850 [Pseudomonadota bacterium]